MQICGMVNLNCIVDKFKFYFTQQWMCTNTGNHVAGC